MGIAVTSESASAEKLAAAAEIGPCQKNGTPRDKIPASCRMWQVEMDSKPAVRQWLQPRGAVLGGLGVVLLVAGLWRVDGVLAALGLASLCLLGLAWWMARVNPAGLDVAVHGPEKVVAGAVFPLALTLVNRHRVMDAFGIRVELQLAGKSSVHGRAAWVAAGSAADLEWRAVVPGRAWVEKRQVKILSDFPFGFFEVERTLGIGGRMIVLPQPVVPRGLRFAGAMMDAPHASGVVAGQSPGEPCGLREWRSGDSPKRVLWPATLRSLARGAGMVVRETDPPGFCPRRCVVVFHSFGADGGLIRPDRFERAISLVAGILRQLRGMGMPVRLVADFDGWIPRPAHSSAHLVACMEMLARARRAEDTEAHDLTSVLAGIPADEGLIVVSDMPVGAWRDLLPKVDLQTFVPQAEAAKLRKGGPR